jgi:hypothetical protein
MKRIVVLLSMAAALLAVTFPAAAVPPTNDNFADAQVVTVATRDEQAYVQDTDTAGYATTEAGENTCADQYSIWYTFTLDETTRVGISAQTVVGVYPDVFLREARVGLYEADGQTLLRCEVGGALKNAAFAETLNAGTYYIQVGAGVDAPTRYRVFFQEPALNDDFENAREISIPAPMVLTAPGMSSVEADEPACATQYTVWYKFTLDKRTTMSFFGNTPAYYNGDMSLGIFRDDGPLTLVDCRHGIDTYTVFTRTLDAGTYYLQLGAASLPTFYMLTIHTTPPNDDFSNAKKMTFPYDDYAGANLATFEPGTETHGSGSCGGTLYHTVWYKFKLTEKMTVVLNADGYIYLDDIPVEDGGVPTHRKVYIDLWRKDGTGKTPIGCINREMPEMRKTLNPGTYFVRLASTKKGPRRLPSHYRFTAVAEPLGMPLIVDPPDDIQINRGWNTTLSVVATGLMPMTYQWYEGSTGDTSNPIPGAMEATYTTPALTGSGQYLSQNYWVRITNPVGSRDSTTANVWATYTPVTTQELLSNGGFEQGSLSWTVANNTGDKTVCGTASIPAQGNGSGCAFVFKGGAGENAKLIQQASGVVLAPNDDLRLRTAIQSTGAASKLKAQIKVTLSGNPAEVRTFKVIFRPSVDYALWQSDFFEGSGADALLDAITLTFTHTSASGKMYVDDVSLVRVRYSGSTRGAVLPPPAAPEGFRGAN